MKRLSWLIAAAVLVAFAAPTLAGDSYKCEADAQTCLNHMATKLKNKGWLGVEMDKGEGDELYTITRVVPDSPAEEAGFHVGDVLAGYNDLMFADATEEERTEARKTMTIGADVTYVVVRNGENKELSVTLAAVPEDVMAQWIGHHMLEHVTVASAEALND